MKYLTTLEVARELGISKQTLLNWLYLKKVPEPPRDKRGYRLWSPSRVRLAKALMDEGRLNRRTVVHRQASRAPDVLTAFARELNQFLREAQIEPSALLHEARRLGPKLWSRSKSRGRGERR